MHPFSTLIDGYLAREGVSTSRSKGAVEVTVSTPATPTITLVIPDDCLEWFVSVVDRSTGEELASDWCDHYATDGETDEQLHHEMGKEIAMLLDQILETPVRVIAIEKRSWIPWRKPKLTYALQSRVGSEWLQIIPFLPASVGPGGGLGSTRG